MVEQFPKDQEVFIGSIDEAQPDTIVVFSISDIIFSNKHLILLDTDSAKVLRPEVEREVKRQKAKKE